MCGPIWCLLECKNLMLVFFININGNGMGEQCKTLIQIVRKMLISEIVALVQPPVPEDRTLQALCFFLESSAPVGRYIDDEDTDNE